MLSGTLIHGFETSRGIELLDNLHGQSLRMKQVYDDYVNSLRDQDYFNKFRIQKKQAPNFKVEKGDILQDDWSEADFILANSTCFGEDMMN